jgi:hypothetical protein
MSLKSLRARIRKLEQSQQSNIEPDPPNQRQWREFIRSERFINMVREKANTLFSTMSNEHALIVLTDANKVYTWHQKRREASDDDIYGDRYPYLHNLTELFADMVEDSICDLYPGPLALPPQAVSEFIQTGEESQVIKTTGKRAFPYDECEDCAYPVLTRVENAPCLMCGGKTGGFAFGDKHPEYPNEFRLAERKKRAEKHLGIAFPLFTPCLRDSILFYLGAMWKYARNAN